MLDAAPRRRGLSSCGTKTPIPTSSRAGRFPSETRRLPASLGLAGGREAQRRPSSSGPGSATGTEGGTNGSSSRCTTSALTPIAIDARPGPNRRRAAGASSGWPARERRRTMDPFATLSSAARSRLRVARHPAWVQPMLATLTEARFSDPGWIFERKFDGERVLAFREGARVRLLSRSRQHLDGTYPELVDALGSEVPEDFVIDGEVAASTGPPTSSARRKDRLGIRDPPKRRRARSASTT